MSSPWSGRHPPSPSLPFRGVLVGVALGRVNTRDNGVASRCVASRRCCSREGGRGSSDRNEVTRTACQFGAFGAVDGVVAGWRHRIAVHAASSARGPLHAVIQSQASLAVMREISCEIVRDYIPRPMRQSRHRSCSPAIKPPDTLRAIAVDHRSWPTLDPLIASPSFLALRNKDRYGASPLFRL